MTTSDKVLLHFSSNFSCFDSPDFNFIREKLERVYDVSVSALPARNPDVLD